MRQFIFALGISMAGCVSLGLPKKSRQSLDVTVDRSPGSGFVAVEDASADAVWQRSKSYISVYTDCRPEMDVPLDAAARSLFSHFDSLLETEISTTEVQKREARAVRLTGMVDGLSAEALFHVYKYEGCQVTLSFVAAPKEYAQGENVFLKFSREFQVK